MRQKRGVPEDRREADLRCGTGGRGWLLLRHDEENEERDSRRCHGQNGEQAAPADALNDQLGWTCCGQRAERAQHDVPAIGEGDALRRKPQDDRLEAGHQTDRHPKPDQGAAEHEAPDAVGKSEHKGPGGGEQKQGAVDEPWSVAVEEHAAGEQDRGEHQEIRRREQAEIGGAQPEVGPQVAGDQRIDGAEQVGEVVAGCEGQQHSTRRDAHGTWGSFRQNGIRRRSAVRAAGRVQGSVGGSAR